jgi:hypothetical protein
VTSVLAAFTHAQLGSDCTRRLLRGMVMGFVAFAVFCATAALSLSAVSTAAAFGLASAVAVALQAMVITLRSRFEKGAARTGHGGPVASPVQGKVPA